MAKGQDPVNLSNLGFTRELSEKDGTVYWVKRSSFSSALQTKDAADIKEYMAAQRKAHGKDHVKAWSIFREAKSGGIHQLNKFRFRPTLRDGVYIPFYGPDLQGVHNKTQNKRRDSIKTKNFRILSLLWFGSYDAPLRCIRSNCPNQLVGHEDLGIKIRGMDGDIHHIVVWENNSLAKADKDPSKLLEGCDLFDGTSLVSQMTLAELKQCVPFCDNCHGRRHKAMYDRNPETAHGDFSDYIEVGDVPYFLQSQEKYDHVDGLLQLEGYPPSESMEDFVSKLYLPEDLKILI